MSAGQSTESSVSPLQGRGLEAIFASLPRTQEHKGLTGRTAALSPQCHWSFLEAKEVMAEVEEPALSETHGLGEPSQAGGYLMTLAKGGKKTWLHWVAV